MSSESHPPTLGGISPIRPDLGKTSSLPMGRALSRVLSLTPLVRWGFRALLPLGLGTTLTVGLAIGSLLIGWFPALERVTAAASAYEAARQAQLRQKSARTIMEELKTAQAALPMRKEFGELILAISTLAQQDAIAIPGMTYSFQKIEDSAAVKASITFKAAGAYPGIRQFIHRLETSGVSLFIESLDVSRADRSSQVTFTLRVVTFLRPDPAPSGDSAPRGGSA